MSPTERWANDNPVMLDCLGHVAAPTGGCAYSAAPSQQRFMLSNVTEEML